MRKIAIALSKGGVGKTTTATNLSYGLAWKGAKVLLIDCDTQAQCSRTLGVQPVTGLADLFMEAGPFDILTKARKNLWLLAGSRALAKVKTMIAQEPMRQEYQLSDRLKPYEGKFDFVILDTSPGWDTLTINVLVYADEILCPVSLETLSIDGFLSFNESVQPIEEHYGSKIRYILPTFLDGRTAQSGEILENLRNHFADQLCAPIRYTVKISEAPSFGKTIFEYAIKTRGAEDYSKLIRSVLNG